VHLRMKVENLNTHVKFMNNSTILDDILDSQRSPNDKYGLGYNKQEATPMKLDEGPSFVKSERRFDATPSCSKSERNTIVFKR
jgi:hypothetical protein